MGWGLGSASAGWAVSAVFFWCSVPLLAVSSISQKMLRQGVEFRKAVVAPVAMCMLLGAACLAAAAMIRAVEVKFLLFAFGVGLMPVVGATMTIVISHVTPAAQRNKLLLVLTTSIAFAGLPAPYISGLLIGRSPAGYDHAVLCAAAIAVLGGILTLMLFVRKSVFSAERH
jgi:hypothetical protein